MKHMKKFTAMLLAVIMVLGMAMSASAATNDSITIESAKPGETYTLYKMLDLVVDNDENPTKYSYTVNEKWTTFFAEDGAGAAYVTIENGYVKKISNPAALAKAAAEWNSKPAALQTVVCAEDDAAVVFDGLANGYYLITSSLGTIAMAETTPDANNVTITEKNPEDTITKKVKEDSTGKYDKENDAQIGDIVEFESVITLHKGTRNVTITDTMDSGLTYNKDASIAGLNKGTDYTITESNNGFVIVFSEQYLNGLTGDTELKLIYSAILNEQAIANATIVNQNNKIVLNYGDKQSVEAITTTTTHKVTVNKYANNVENLAGAVFSLKKNGEVVKLIKIDDTNYRVANGEEEGYVTTFTTVATGDIVIWGLDTDTDYTLEEITAPSGYNKLPNEVIVTVNADNSSKIDIENKTGTELPSTGGIGTTIFYIAGAVLVLAAVVLLVTKRRMKAE